MIMSHDWLKQLHTTEGYLEDSLEDAIACRQREDGEEHILEASLEEETT